MSWHSRVLVVVIAAVSLFAVVGCDDDDNPTKPKPVVKVDPNALSMVRTDWRLASMPYPLQAHDYEWTRGTIRWHNPPAIAREQAFPWEDNASGQGSLVPLRLIYRPHGYKYIGDPDNRCSDSALAKSWGGIMMPFKPVIPKGVPLFFEMRAKGGRGILHFDFGLICEDINGNGLIETEDHDPHDYILEEDEDTGLDRKMDTEEADVCGNVFNSTTNPDPAGDNWWFEGDGKGAGSDNRPPVPLSLWNAPGFRAAVEDDGNWRHYEWLNGTEGNIDDGALQGVPDREAPGTSVNEFNHYFSLSMELDTTGGPYMVPGSAHNGWVTYRVALCACPGVVDTIADEYFTNQMTWSAVEQVRVWFEQDTTGVDSIASMDSVWIAEWKLITEY